MEVCVELFTSVVLFMFDLSSSLRVLVRVVFTFGATKNSTSTFCVLHNSRRRIDLTLGNISRFSSVLVAKLCSTAHLLLSKNQLITARSSAIANAMFTANALIIY